jgi:hypothetical protein
MACLTWAMMAMRSGMTVKWGWRTGDTADNQFFTHR